MKSANVYAALGTIQAASASAPTDTFDGSRGNAYRTGARTANLALTVQNLQPGVVYTIEFGQDGTGGRTLTISGQIWASISPAICPTSNVTTVITFCSLRPGTITLINVTSGEGLVLGKDATSILNLANKQQTTIGANGAAAALTANPAGYINIRLLNGTEYVIPFYNR